MKQVQAIIAALVITAFTGLGIFAIGSNAFLNTNTVPIQNSPNDANTAVVTTTGASAESQVAVDAATQAQLKQMQDLVTQYQAREKQYQTELADAAQKLKDATSQAQQAAQQVQQYQDILMQLQQRGVIRVTADGQIQIPRRGGNVSEGTTQ
jgi:predicted Rossmann fold nucleotide-binding protein DprA/Smf involved in DNA uptake